MTSLRELESVAYHLSSRRIDDLDALKRWLAVLVAPGASLGGARPKANFTEADGALWIGKFPAHDDERDVGAWEYVTRELAIRAGVDMPPAKVIRLNSDFHTYCVKRFDRVGSTRRFYASAMTLLQKDQSEGTSYLELAPVPSHARRRYSRRCRSGAALPPGRLQCHGWKSRRPPAKSWLHSGKCGVVPCACLRCQP